MTTDAATAGEDISHAEILRRLPHRYPFLMIDRAEAFLPSRSIVGIKNVTFNEPFFPGHFPGDPVMPGVLLIEAMAQTGALLMGKTMQIDVSDKIILFMSIDNARFRLPVRPGDQLRIPVEVTRARGDIYKFKGRAMVNGRVAADCDFAAMVAPSARNEI
jgi:3-hydroxyacyl-[acyl-carrier-protein] dehydratase